MTPVRDRDRLTDKQRPHYEAFMEAFRGVPAYLVDKALRAQMHTIWRGCSKEHMAYCYAEAMKPHTPYTAHPIMKRLDIPKLAQQARTEQQRAAEWRARRQA